MKPALCLPSDKGSVSILTIALGALIVGAGFIVIAVLQLAIVRANLGSFADLAALAAGQSVGEPCAAAMRIAHANSVHLDSCVVGDQVVHISVTQHTNNLGVLNLFTDQLRAHASATQLVQISE